MKEKFYEKEFDDATMLKLEIFRRYLREWIPVFMTRQKDKPNLFAKINIYDYFAGPGRDNEGNPGSPLIIVDEIKRFCLEKDASKFDVELNMFFNDINEQYIVKLEKAVSEIACNKSCCNIHYSAYPFSDILPKHISVMNDPGAANLLIMDQFGIKEVTPDVISILSNCKTTEVLFFISTSFIRRFIETPEIGDKYELNSIETKNIDFNIIHRYICDHFRGKIKDRSYYLAPFSIKKGSNIYGIIFGTSHLFGLEKFLKVCWTLDNVTGEANYNIDRDFTWNGDNTLFDECNKISKISLFEKEVCEYIASEKPTNIVLNEFCLINGFPPNKAGEVFASLQERNIIFVWDIEKNALARKKAFYLGWNNCKTKIAKVRYSMETPK